MVMKHYLYNVRQQNEVKTILAHGGIMEDDNGQ